MEENEWNTNKKKKVQQNNVLYLGGGGGVCVNQVNEYEWNSIRSKKVTLSNKWLDALTNTILMFMKRNLSYKNLSTAFLLSLYGL